MTTATAGRIRTDSPLTNALHLRQHGFLRFMTDVWQAQGDLATINFGPIKAVLAVHPDAVKYVTVDHHTNFVKGKSYNIPRKLFGNAVLTSVGDDWRRQRKLMAPFFTPRGIQQYGDRILAATQAFARQWDVKAQAGTPVEMTAEMMELSATIILQTIFSVDDDTAIGPLKVAVDTLIGTIAKLYVAFIQLPWWIPTPTHRHYHAARHQVDQFINGIITQRRAMPQSEWPNDLLAHLMAAPDEETGRYFSDQELLDECITLFFAGYETTARTLAYTWWMLSQHPDVEARFHDELVSVVGNRAPTLEDLKHLPYTFQVLRETLRLYPPAPQYGRDVVQEDAIGGHPIPAGAVMMLLPYLTHRHPDFWPEPERFDPDRWLPEIEQARHPYAYHPFAAGQRICIGNHFSLFESHIVLSILGQQFAPRLLEGHHPEIEMAGTLIAKNGILMTLGRRQT
jgi:cytochrome P450